MSKIKSIAAHCSWAGTIKLGGTSSVDSTGTDHSGAHAAYEFTSAETLYKVASGYTWVQRPNGKSIRGKDYTLRMAANDFAYQPRKSYQDADWGW